jgi:hypothetical protein
VVCLRVATCLGAWLALLGHWGDLGGFARELASTKYPFASAIACFEALSALPVCDMSGLNVYTSPCRRILEKKNVHARLKPKNTRVACRDTLDKNKGRGINEHLSSVDAQASYHIRL